MDILHLQVKSEFNITGRGTVIVVNLEANGYKDLINKDLRDIFMEKKVEYKGAIYTIWGIEIMGAPDRSCKETAFLIKSIKI